MNLLWEFRCSAGIMTEKSDDGLFEWDAAKNIINIYEHGISFQ